MYIVGAYRTGINATNSFRPNIARQNKLAISTHIILAKNIDHNIDFQGTRQFFRRKLAKIAPNSDPDFDPRPWS
jgi:hypothetical protein